MPFLAWGLLVISSFSAATRYVDVSNATPAAPYTSWGSAATAIQPAIDEATSGDEILVAPGTYLLGGSAVVLPIEKSLTLRSIQSRAAVIDAQGLSAGLSVSGPNSVVEGFTVRNGFAASYGGGISIGRYAVVRDCLVTSNRAWGAGGIVIYGEATNARIERCTIAGNQAASIGGGVVFYHHSQGMLDQCVIRDNIASNEGGGVYFQQGGTVSNCWVSGNLTLTGDGGGAYLTPEGTTNAGRIVNSVLVDNRAGQNGGGAYCSGPTGAPASFINCTIVSNAAAVAGGGISAYGTRVVNSILYFNTAPAEENMQLRVPATVVVSNCCTTFDHGWPSITNAPAFVDAAAGDFRLATASFGIDAGTTTGAPGTDIDGNLRPRIGKPGMGVTNCDMGAYEYAFHFNEIRTTGANEIQFKWDVEDRGIYRLQAATNAATAPANPFWENVMAFTNAGMPAGQFLVHTQAVSHPVAMPGHVLFRLLVGHTPF